MASAPQQLLARADALLSEAIAASSPQDLFLGAYVAALRGAGAMLAVSEGSRGARGRHTRNAWLRLAESAPELAPWAEYFSAYSATRAAVEAGAARSMSSEEADRFFGEVGRFLHDVEGRLGAAIQLDQRAS
ncbi:MAG: hypothetical protein GX542_00790 [Rhodococcus sp.]|nr:hypothetical protein [Rhodococcus sp. (in: high G+C Gram-positive bacteria)]